jgi:hypothetical protein
MTPLIGEFFVTALFGKNFKQYEWATSQLGCPWEVRWVKFGVRRLYVVAGVFVLLKRP